MTYRLSQFDVPADNVFKNDALNRRPLVDFLTALIERTGGPFVLAIDSSWGTGKTILVRMLQGQLVQQNFSCIYFNAWEVDYVTDPLVALVSCIDSLKIGETDKEVTFRDHLKTMRQVTSLVAKRAIVAGTKALTVGALDLEDEMEAIAKDLAGDSAGDIVEAFHKERSLLKKFREELEAAIAQLPSIGKKPLLVFFIDEIDRCRPTFAIELLERIKHLFDVSNILFILSLDKQQLEASIAAVYGQGINASEYLRRFIDLEYGLSTVTTKQFVTSLFSRFELDEIFAQRTHRELSSDRSTFITFFTALADSAQLSLRSQERCFTRLRIVMDQTPADHYLEPVLVALLIVLRLIEPGLFKRLIRGEATASDVMKYLSGLKNGTILVEGRMGIAIEAYLIASDENYDRNEATKASLVKSIQDKNKPEHIRARDESVLDFVRQLGRTMRGSPQISFVARKIDIAAGLKE